jgi:hypothetical protein
MTLLLLLILLTSSEPSSLAQKCVAYEPDTVSLAGTIKRRTFAGAPNYESVARGDQPEQVWVLRLARPICVSASGDQEEEKNVSDLQLVFTDAEKEYPRYRSFVGRRVTVNGTLFHAHTGHHHTSVLLTVNRISKR